MLCGFALNLWLWQGTFPKVILRGGALTPNIAHPDGTIEVARRVIPTITIPHIAFTWYVLIGALVTFAIGALFSLIFRKQSRRTVTTTAALLLLLFFLSFPQGTCFTAGAQIPKPATSNQQPTTNFSPITTLLNAAIAAHKLPGAVVLIGHNGKVVFEQAYGDRKLAGEPGLDGKPSPAEPMTEDTIFDMASLTKCLATATAVMQLYEQARSPASTTPSPNTSPSSTPTNPGDQHSPPSTRR